MTHHRAKMAFALPNSVLHLPFSACYPPLFILLLAFTLRVYRLDFQPLWWDEGYSVFFASKSLYQLLNATAADIHPPLYYLMLRGWSSIATFSPWNIRFLSVAMSMLGVALLYTLGRRLTSRRASLVAAGILTLSPFQIHHAQEARMYPLVTTLTLLSTYLLIRALDDGSSTSPTTRSEQLWSKGLWAGYTFVTVLTLLTHYYTLFVPLFQGAYVILRYRSATVRWITAMATGATLYAPWLAMIASELPKRTVGKVAAEADPTRSPLVFVGRYLSTATVGYNASGPATALAAGIAAGLILLGAFKLQRRTELPLLYLAIPVAGGLLLNQMLPFEAFPRLLAYAAPAAYLLIASSLAQFQHWRFGTILILISLIIPYPHLYTTQRQVGEDYRPIIAKIDELTTPQDLVILDFPWQAGYLLAYSQSRTDWWIAPGATWSKNPSQMDHDLKQLRQQHPRLWYVAEAGLGSERGQNIEGHLIHHTYLALDQWYDMNRLLLFGTAETDPRQSINVNFGPHIQLTGIAIPQRIEAGGILPVRLEWRSTDSTDRRLKTFVHLLNTAGQVVAQRDAEPVASLRPTNTWQPGDHITDHIGVLIPQNISAGRYQIEIGLYEPSTGQRLPVSQAGQPLGNRLLAGPVTVQN